MESPNELVVNGVTYVRKDTVAKCQESKKKNRMVIVGDREWVFAGDATLQEAG